MNGTTEERESAEPADPDPAAAGGGGPHGPVAEHDLHSAGAGAFPLGGRAVGWIESKIDGWLRERIAESRGGDE